MKKLLIIAAMFAATTATAQTRPAMQLAQCPAFQSMVWVAAQNEAYAALQDTTRHKQHRYAAWLRDEPMNAHWLNAISAAVVTAYPNSDTTTSQDSINYRVISVFPECQSASAVK